ncbi:MAG: hypothetical protein AAF661_02320 [Pseudomonadota bacterium]
MPDGPRKPRIRWQEVAYLGGGILGAALAHDYPTLGLGIVVLVLFVWFLSPPSDDWR